MAKQSPTTRVADRMEKEVNASSKRIIANLSDDFNDGDAENMSKSDWYQMIRDNWNDPMFRQRQSVKLGPVKFVQDAMLAFGLDPKTLGNLPTPMELTPNA